MSAASRVRSFFKNFASPRKQEDGPSEPSRTAQPAPGSASKKSSISAIRKRIGTDGMTSSANSSSSMLSSAAQTLDYWYSKWSSPGKDPVVEFKNHWFDLQRKMEELVLQGSELQGAPAEERKAKLQGPNSSSRDLITTMEAIARREYMQAEKTRSSNESPDRSLVTEIQDFILEQEVLTRICDFGIKNSPPGARQITLKLVATLLQYVDPVVLQVQHARQQLGKLMHVTFEHYEPYATYRPFLRDDSDDFSESSYEKTESALRAKASRHANRSFYWLTRTACVLLLHFLDNTNKLIPFFLFANDSQEVQTDSSYISLPLLFRILTVASMEQAEERGFDAGGMAREALVMCIESEVKPVIALLHEDDQLIRVLLDSLGHLWESIRVVGFNHSRYSIALLESLLRLYDAMTVDDEQLSSSFSRSLQTKLKDGFERFLQQHIISVFHKGTVLRNDAVLLLFMMDQLESSRGKSKLCQPFLRTKVCRLVGGADNPEVAQGILDLCKSDYSMDSIVGMELVSSLLRSTDISTCCMLTASSLPPPEQEVIDKLHTLCEVLDAKLKEWWNLIGITLDTSPLVNEVESLLLRPAVAEIEGIDFEPTQSSYNDGEGVTHILLMTLQRFFYIPSEQCIAASSVVEALFSVPQLYGIYPLLVAEATKSSTEGETDENLSFQNVLETLWDDAMERVRSYSKRSFQAALHDARNERNVTTLEEIEPLQEAEVPEVKAVQTENEEFLKHVVVLEQMTLEIQLFCSMMQEQREIVKGL